MEVVVQKSVRVTILFVSRNKTAYILHVGSLEMNNIFNHPRPSIRWIR